MCLYSSFIQWCLYVAFIKKWLYESKEKGFGNNNQVIQKPTIIMKKAYACHEYILKGNITQKKINDLI